MKNQRRGLVSLMDERAGSDFVLTVGKNLPLFGSSLPFSLPDLFVLASGCWPLSILTKLMVPFDFQPWPLLRAQPISRQHNLDIHHIMGQHCRTDQTHGRPLRSLGRGR